MTLLARLRAAWAVLVDREHKIAPVIEDDAEAALRRLHDRLIYATRILKELPMALIDDINTLGTAIDTALAAKDTANAATASQLSAANDTITTLTGQITAADAAVVALTAKLTPAAAPVPVADPAAPVTLADQLAA